MRLPVLPNLHNEWYLQYIQRMGIVISTAEYDFCKADSFKLANILQEKKKPLKKEEIIEE